MEYLGEHRGELSTQSAEPHVDDRGTRKDRMVIGAIAWLVVIVVVFFAILLFVAVKIGEKYGEKIGWIFVTLVIVVCIWYVTRQHPEFTRHRTD